MAYCQAATNGYLDFNLISLFPPTYKNRKNGNRIDLMQALADIKPVRACDFWATVMK